MSIINKTLNKFLGTALISLAVVLPTAALASPIVLFNTGVNDLGLGLGSLAKGASDSHYQTALSTSPVVVSSGAYAANTVTSQWIWASAAKEVATYTFMTTFDLTGFDESTAIINGLWGADNQGLDIKINGVSTGISLLSTTNYNYASLHAFSIASDFVSGLNTLEFVIQNTGSAGAFRTELTGNADRMAVPEPGTAALLGLALAGLTLYRRKKTI